MNTVKLTCPQCGQHYSVELDPSMAYDDMDCPQCGGKIPVSAVPPAAPPPPEADPNSLLCPICKHVFVPPFDVETHVGGCECPKCGSGLPLPLEKNLVNRMPKPPAAEKKHPATKPVSSPPPAAPFFFCCSMGSFIAADIAAISESPVLANSLYWSGVAFVLLAIYLKIQWK